MTVLLVSFILTFLIAILVGLFIIPALKHIGYQPIRSHGPDSHLISKTKTPTMGGSIFLIASLVGIGLFCDLKDRSVMICIITMLFYATLGFVDDYHKLRYQTHSGISSKMKFMVQLLGSILIYCYLEYYNLDPHLHRLGVGTMSINIGMFYPVLAVLIIIGASNAVNLTDGLDGLAILPVAIVLLFFAYMGYDHNIMLLDTENISQLSILCVVVAAACLGFLWYNAFPAQVFMGDIGSLSLGALLGVISIIMKVELLFAIAGGLFVVETVSVILQVWSYKRYKKRIFLMTPIHHHFEKLGYAEQNIVVRSWIITALLTLFAILISKS